MLLPLKPLRAKALLAATSALLLVTVSGCKPFVYCGECGVHPDGGVDAPAIDVGTDASVDAPSIDMGMDAGPPPIPSPLDGTTLPSRVCSLGGWCWLSPPVPPDASWSDVAAVGASEAWIVTEDPVDHVTPGGAILHFDGTSWRGLVGVGARRVAGSGPSDVWFLAGDHVVTHWDGTMFHAALIPAALLIGGTGVLRDIGSASATDVWAVGDGGLFLHYDGTTWTAVPAGVGIRDLTSVHVAAAGDVWVAGAAGIVRHFATDWQPIDAPSEFDVDAIWAPAGATAAGQQSAWIGGDMGARYWDVAMSSWRTPTGAAIANIRAISGRSVSDVYMLSADGTDFDAFHTSIVPVADGSPECARVAVAPFGTGQYLRVGGRVSAGTRACSIDLMTSTSPGVDGTSPSIGIFGAVRSVAPTDATGHALLVYAADGARTGDPTTMTFMTMPSLVPMGATSGTIDIEAAVSSTDVWLDVHDAPDTRWHWDGTAWSAQVPSAGATSLVFATRASETWVAAGSAVYAWVGSAFVAHGSLADPVRELAVVGGGAAWAIHGASLAHYDGTTWTDLPVASLPSDCAPLVARGTDAVECLSTGGRLRFMLDGSGGVIMPASGVPTFAPGEARALVGERAWMFARGAAGEADERILWSDLAEQWNPRSSGWAGDGVLRMLGDGTTWRVTNGSLLEWRPR